MPQVAKYLMLAGLLLAAGVIYWLIGHRLHWIGRLPGDIHIKRDNIQVYIPITSMLLASILLSIILWIVRRLG